MDAQARAELTVKRRRGRPGHPIGPPETALGIRLHELRTRDGLTKGELAAKVGTAPNRLADWENGYHLPQLPALKRLAHHFGLSVSELLDGVM
jgi:transcriptional regulator with XRE-family HTH domain